MSKHKLLIAIFCLLGTVAPVSYAQTPDLTKQNTAINDIKALFQVWKTTEPQHASDIKDFINYFYNVKKTDERYSRLYHSQFLKSAYQPFYILNGGGFIMRGYLKSATEVTFEVDVDGEVTICPDYPEQIKLNVNDKGDVYVAP